MKKFELRKYVVAARNGYYAVDEYRGNSNTRTIASGLKKKQAEEMLSAINGAIYQFMSDNKLTDEGYGAAMAGTKKNVMKRDFGPMEISTLSVTATRIKGDRFRVEYKIGSCILDLGNPHELIDQIGYALTEDSIDVIVEAIGEEFK